MSIRSLVSRSLAVTTTFALALAALVAFPAAANAAELPAPTSLTAERRTNPVDVSNLANPVLGWLPPATVREFSTDTTADQVSYQVRVGTTSAIALSESPDVWDSGVVASGANEAAYAGPALAASTRYWFTVRTVDGDGLASAWANPSWFGTSATATFTGASTIWAGSPSTTWSDYTFTGTFKIVQANATVALRGTDANNYYMWQFQSATNSLVTHKWVGGTFTVLKTVPLGTYGVTLDTTTTFPFKFELDGANITTWINGIKVDESTDSTYAAGWIGLRTGSSERTQFDNFVVTAKDGSTLYSNNFSTAADFPCGTVAAGVMSVAVSQKCLFDPWANYTLEMNVKVSAVAAGVVFRAVDSNNYFLWQFRATENTLAPHTNVAGTFTKLVTTNVPLGSALAIGSTYPVKIVANGSTIQTYFNGNLVETRTNTTYTRGYIGFRHGSSESAAFSNVSVKSPSGSVVYANTFAAGNSDFACGSVASNTLTVGVSAACVLSSSASSWVFARSEVTLDNKQIAWASLYATGASTSPAKQYVYKAYINGTFVGLGPTFPIGSETRYDGYDVTSLLTAGTTNAIGAILYSSADQRFLAKLTVHYTDGTEQTFGTGSTWKTLAGSSVYPSSGSIGTSYFVAPKENLQAASYPTGFATAGFNDSTWTAAAVKAPFTTLAATPMAKVEQRYETGVSVTERAPGDYVIDFGESWAGGVALDLTAAGGEVVDIRYGEVLSGGAVKYAMSTGNNYQDKWTLAAGENSFETWGLRVFRYVEIIGSPEAITLENAKALALVYPFDESEATFTSSDSNLNQVWELSRHTIEAMNLNLYVDSWTRERGPYEADAYIQQMAHAALSSDPTLGDYSMDYLIAKRTWPTEWPLYTILSVHDSWMSTGSTEQITAQYSALQGKLLTSLIDPATGLVKKAIGSGGTNTDLVDWPAGERDGYVFSTYNTVINSLAYRTYVVMAEMAAATGHTADAQTYTTAAANLRTAINTQLYDPTVGAYRDGLDSTTAAPLTHFATHASAFALAFGVVDDSEKAKVAAWLAPKGMACSVYCAGFLLDGLYSADAGDTANDLMTSTATRSWMNMIAVGAGATMEAWDLSFKSNATYSHPWATAPAYEIPSGMFGINPTGAGYTAFEVKPQPGDIDNAAISVPTAQGSVRAAFDQRASGSVDVAVSVPAGAVASVSIPTGDAAGTTVYVDGVATTAVASGARLVVSSVLSGCHVFSTQAGSAAGQNATLTGICPTAYAAPKTVPMAPATVSAIAGHGDAVVTWEAPASDGGSTIAGYTVTSSPDGLTCSTTGATECTVSGLANGTAYTFTVVASNAGGASPASAASDSVTPTSPATAPAAPTTVSATPANGAALVTWSAPEADGGSVVTGYSVTSSPGMLTCETTGDLECSVAGLTNGTAYTFAVVATNAAGSSVASEPSSAVTPGRAPDAPTAVTAAATSGEATVSWAAPADNGGAAISAYAVTSFPGGLTCATTGDVECVVTGLTNGTEYSFTVVATNSWGTSPQSAPSAGVTPSAVVTVPGAPTSVSALAAAGSAEVTWAAPMDDGGAAIESYTVTSSPGGLTCSTTGALSCTVIGLTNGTPYTFTVTAGNSSGSSLPSEPSSAVTPLAVPGAPTAVVATAGDASATVSWAAPVDNGGAAITGYTVKTTNDAIACTTVGDLECTVTGLTNGTEYSFTVTASNSVGPSAPSAASSGVTPTATPVGPHFADVTDTQSQFYPYIQWMYEEGISTGTPQPSGDPLYKPASPVSRQAMASFLYKLSGDAFTAPVEPSFADVDASNPFYTAIEWMAAEQISTGTPQSSGKPLYKPADAVSRQAMALFLSRYAGATPTAPTEQAFADVPIGSAPAAAIGWMAETGISTGTPQASGLPLYKPLDAVSRQAMAAFLYRVAHLG